MLKQLIPWQNLKLKLLVALSSIVYKNQITWNKEADINLQIIDVIVDGRLAEQWKVKVHKEDWIKSYGSVDNFVKSLSRMYGVPIKIVK